MLFEEIVLFFLANRLTNQKELNFDFNLSNLPSILNLIEYQSPPPPFLFGWFWNKNPAENCVPSFSYRIICVLTFVPNAERTRLIFSCE